jgi:cyanate permease
VVHGGVAVAVGTAATTAGGGVLVIAGIALCAVLVPSFVRYRVIRHADPATA